MTGVDVATRQSGVGGGQPVRTSRRAAVVALARAEGRRLVRHPLVWIGVALGALLVSTTLWDARFVLPRESVIVQVGALPIAAATLVAAHLATTRPRRDAVTELLVPAAHGEDARTLALLVAVLVPAALTAGLVGAVLGVMAAMGAAGALSWAEAATAPALVAGGGAVGVLWGRVAPWRLAALFAVVALIMVQLLLSEVGGPGNASVVELLGPAVLPAGAPHDPAALLRPSALHLLYVLGGVAGLAVAAALTSRVTPRRVVALAVALAVAGTAGILQMRAPGDGQVRELLTRVSDPVVAGDCTTDATGATVCALPMFRGWRDGWQDIVTAVRAPLFDHGVDPGPLTVAQRANPAEARAELSRWYDVDDGAIAQQIADAWEMEGGPPTATVVLTSYWPRASDLADPARLGLALHTARLATGLPAGVAFHREDASGSWNGMVPCSPVGQAREALTIWLAARAHPAAAGALGQAVTDEPYPGTPADPVDDGSGIADVTPGLDLYTAAVAGHAPEWSKPGAHVAMQMLDRPTDALLEQLGPDWSRWTDPTTSLRDLVDELDLDMPPLAAELQEQLEDVPVDGNLADAFRDTPLPAPPLDEEGRPVVDIGPNTDLQVIGCP